MMPDPFGLERIATELAGFERERLRMFATSSFQTNSVVLLHLISRFAPRVPVYFLNTGFHFPETLDFQRSLSRLLSLDVRALFSPVARSQQRDMDGRLLFASDPDRCCYLNKVLPLDAVIAQHDLWISGIRSEQSNARAALGRHATGRLGVRRYHPILDWDGQMVHDYIEQNGLPRHPLEVQGYVSIGCSPCTQRPCGDEDRWGRWEGLRKTECGLHLPRVES